jgi:2-polyprenyl-3-methyl-5-hydroxy-6-metoxy-1,4-benzoquinol methylase
MTANSDKAPNSLGTGRIEKIQRFFARDTTYLKKDFNLRMRAEIVKSLAGLIRGSKVLDLGCGDGSLCRQFLDNGNRVVMVDASEDMLELARTAAPENGAFECEYIHADFLEHALSERFDLILCLGVLAHVPSIDGVFRIIRSHLSDTGRCILQWSDNQRLAGKVTTIYNALREHIIGHYGYRLNCLRSSNVIHTARLHGLFPVSLTRYHLMLPGMGRLPNEVLYRFQRMTLENRAMRVLSTDVIGLFSADPRSSIEVLG